MATTIEERLPIRIVVRVKGIEFTDELRNAVERIIAFAVDRHVFQVDSISVYLADLNGPKRGVDKVCQITANLTRGNPVPILEEGNETLSMVNRAAHRLGHRIAHTLQRLRRPDLQRFRKSMRAA